MARRRMVILNRVVVGGDPVAPEREYAPGDECDVEDGTADTMVEMGVARDKADEKPKRRVD